MSRGCLESSHFAIFSMAIGVYRLQQEVFLSRAFWPVLLLTCGLALMVAAANYAPLRVAVAKVWKKRA